MNEVINAIGSSPSLYRGTSFIDCLLVPILFLFGAFSGSGGGSGGGSPLPGGPPTGSSGGSLFGSFGSFQSGGSLGGSVPAGKNTPATDFPQGGSSFFVFL